MTGESAFMPGLARHIMALVLAAVVVMGSPGPSTISATAMGAAFGVRRSLRYVCGLIAGTAAVLVAVALGVVGLAAAMPQGARAIGAIAVAYILYLAFRIATAPPLQGQSADVAAPAFAGGLLLAIANPKAYLAIAAVFAGTSLAEDRMRDAGLKLAVLGAMIVIIHLCWLLAGASLSRVLRDPVWARLVNIALAASLVIVTLALIG